MVATEGTRQLAQLIDECLLRMAAGCERLRREKSYLSLTVAGREAIVPSVAGWARQTGINTIFIDDRDPFAHGFVVK